MKMSKRARSSPSNDMVEKPKAPKTAFELFKAENRDLIKRNNPDAKGVAQINEVITQTWNEYKNKQYYIKLETDARNEYEAELEEYEAQFKPKKPLSSYFIWMKENRSRVQDAHPDASIGEISKICGQMWKDMADKSTWTDKADEAKREYEERLAEIKRSGIKLLDRPTKKSRKRNDND